MPEPVIDTPVERQEETRERGRNRVCFCQILEINTKAEARRFLELESENHKLTEDNNRLKAELTELRTQERPPVTPPATPPIPEPPKMRFRLY